MCQEFCDELRPFTDHVVAEHHVWLHADPQVARPLIAHYFAQKVTAPHTTSACILLPKWSHNPVHPQLKQMRLLREYPKGYHLFQNSNGKRLSGLPCAMQVWYDPPEPVLAAAVQPEARRLAMHYKCQITNARASVLLDTGAQGLAYLSHDFLPTEWH